MKFILDENMQEKCYNKSLLQRYKVIKKTLKVRKQI